MTFAGRALTSGLFHLVAAGLPIATSPNTVWTQTTTRFPLVLPHPHDSPVQVMVALPYVEGGATPRSPKTGVYACHNTFTHPSGTVRCFDGIATPRRPPRIQLTRRSSPLTFVGRALTSGLFHLVATGLPIATSPNTVWTQPTTRFPLVLLHPHDSPSK